MARLVNAASKGGGKILMYSKQPSAFHYKLWPKTLPADVPYRSVSHPPVCGRYQALVSIVRSRERFCWNLLFYFCKQFSWINVLWWKYSEEKNIPWMCRKTQTQMLDWGIYNMLQDFISPVIGNEFKCNFIFVNMPHQTHMCTNTLYDYAIINYWLIHNAKN